VNEEEFYKEFSFFMPPEICEDFTNNVIIYTEK